MIHDYLLRPLTVKNCFLIGNNLRLKDYTTYKGGISKKALTVKGVDGIAFRSYCYVTDDKRWFDRSGMPIDKPKNLLSEKDA